ncbi:MAG: hypothetical protein ACHQ9S_21605 [Candidatus Binatia bacterium]
MRPLTTLTLLIGLLLVPAAWGACPGDLNGDGVVSIDEIVTLVGEALNGCPAGSAVCPGDLDGDGMITIDEILLAVNAALSGCPGQASPTPSATSTTSPSIAAPTATASETPTSPEATATPTAIPATATPVTTASWTPTDPAATLTPTPTVIPASDTPIATASWTPTTPEATPTPTPVPAADTPSPTAAWTPTPSPTPTPSETLSPSATATPSETSTPSGTPTPTATPTLATCPYTFDDDTLSLNASCDYLGAFNSDPNCPGDLEVLFAGDGKGLVGVGLGTEPDIITFVATKQSSTVATLQGWAIGNDTTLEPVTGTVELQDGGRVLVIAPDSSPFSVQISECTFNRYSGTFTAVLSGQGLAPARRLARMQLASR